MLNSANGRVGSKSECVWAHLKLHITISVYTHPEAVAAYVVNYRTVVYWGGELGTRTREFASKEEAWKFYTRYVASSTESQHPLNGFNPAALSKTSGHGCFAVAF